MNKNLYRALFLTDDTQNYTNNFYVAEFTKIVLFKTNISMNIEELVERIEELTELRYTEEEVISAIEQWNDGWLERKSGMYSLSSNGMQQMMHKSKEYDITPFVDVFVKEHELNLEIPSNEIKQLIERFIYLRFNENLQQISDIFNHQLSIDSVDDDFDEKQIKTINEFLNWNHNEKNKCIFHLIAKAYDYCMINSRCSNTLLDFSQFNFYLDTNIIFRMLGLNGSLRQKSINTLIDKCVEVGAHIHVNGFVKSECEHTIIDQINALETVTAKMNGLLPPSSMSFAEERSVRIDFYTRYFDWVKSGNKHRNFAGFKKRILQDLSDLLQKFDVDDETTAYKVTQKNEFEAFYDSLFVLKGDKHTTETDINSFLLVREKRNTNPNEEHYLISADGRFISWLKESIPSSKSYADYPSAWLSILLKYSGRESESDYKSFCQFIHLSITPKVEDLAKKIEIKAKILSSDFSDNIKHMLIEDIQNNYYAYSEYDTEEIIHKSYAKTEAQIKAQVSSEKDKEFRKAFAEQKEKYELELERSINDNKSIQAERDRQVKEAYERGKIDQKNKDKEDIINKETKKTIKKHKIISALLNIGLVVFGIGFLMMLGIMIVKGMLPTDNEIIKTLSDNSLWLTITIFVIEAVIGAFKAIFEIFGILSTDKKTIMEKMEEKYRDM